jgi:signal transduction histidine kinase
MKSAPDGRNPSTIDRQLGWLISLGGCIVILDQTVFRLSELGDWSPWWNGGSLLVAAGVIVLAIGGQHLPKRALVVMWWVLPILYTLLQATWMIGYRGADPNAAVPWLWTIEPPIVTLLLLILRPVAAVVTSLLISLTPAISSLVVMGAIPFGIDRETPNQLGNVVYVVIFIGVRLQLKRLHAVEAESRSQQRRQVRKAVVADQQARLSRLVHDEVLSVLSTAMQADGPPAEVLRAAAGRAITALEESAGSEQNGAALIPVRDAAAAIAGSLRLVDDCLELETRISDGVIRRDVVTAVSLAAGEALRNSLRHAGASASRRVYLAASPDAMRVTIADDGVGFAKDADHHGMGIPESIERRMSECGGLAVVKSAQGQGTEVTLLWPT